MLVLKRPVRIGSDPLDFGEGPLRCGETSRGSGETAGRHGVTLDVMRPVAVLPTLSGRAVDRAGLLEVVRAGLERLAAGDAGPR